MKVLVNLSFIGVALFFQTTTLEVGNILGLKPDFLLVVLTWLALSSNTTRTIEYGFFIGFCQDIFSVGPMGLHTVTKMIIGFLDNVLSKKIIVDSPSNRMIVVIANTFIQALLMGGIVLLMSVPLSIDKIFDRTLFYQMILHGILSLPLMWVMDKAG